MKPVFYKILFEQDIIFVNDLLFELHATNQCSHQDFALGSPRAPPSEK